MPSKPAASASDRPDIRALCGGYPDAIRDKPADDRLRDIADREEILALVATYAHRVAQGLSNADLFTDDGAYIHRRSPGAEPEVSRGRAELDAHYVARPDSVGVATPMIHNSLISLSGDEATHLCSIELRLWHDGASMLASGFYADRLRRDGGHWKFVVREVSFFHWGAPDKD
jgi:hypothetical protein